MDEAAFKKEILIGLEYSYEHDDWVNPLSEALKGVTAEEASWRPSPGARTIWEIVLHLAVWTENIIDRMRTGERCHPADGAWPEPPAAKTEAAWRQAQDRLWKALGALKRFIEENTVDALAAGPYGLGDLFCRFIHNAYHIGQITKMRELRALTKPS